MEHIEFSFPPSVNWYQTQALDVSSQGIVAYGAGRECVVLYPVKNADENINGDWRHHSKWERPKARISHNPFGESQRAKITAVKWSPDGKMLGLASDEGSAKVFIHENHQLRVYQGHSSHKESSKEKFKINAICWTNNTTLVTGDDKGNVIVWDITTHQTRCLSLSKNSIFVLNSHPNLEEIVAFGCRQGLVFIVNIQGKGKVIHKIRAHDEDIYGIDWAPTTENIHEIFKNEEETESDIPLAVSCRDKSVSIWSSKTAKRLAILKLPKSNTRTDQQPFINLKWIDSRRLLVSGPQGELCQWDFDKFSKNSSKSVIKNDGSGQEFKVLHWEHQRNLFNIAKYQDQVFTCGYDRSIVCYNLQNDSVSWNLPTFGSRIVSMAANVVDPSILAIGCGDGQIRIWKTLSSKSMIDYQSIYQKLARTEISSLAWHPERENILAFATDEGRIGFVDGLSPKPNPNFMEFKHRGSVYNLAYGPQLMSKSGNAGTGSCLFSLADSMILMHNKTNNSHTNIEDLISEANQWQRKVPSRSCMEFRPISRDFVVLGSDDGSVELFGTNDMKIVCTLKSFQKLIQSLAWHPHTHSDQQQAESSKHNDYLAVASNEYDIHIWNLKDMIDNSNLQENNTNPVLTKPHIVLSGHKLRTVSLAWSFHNEELLLSVSYDGTAQIWNVAQGCGIANFRDHVSRIFCGIWTQFDKNIVLTGGEDSMLMAWDITKQQDKMPAKKSTKFKAPREKQANLITAVDPEGPTGDSKETVEELLNVLEAKKTEIQQTPSAPARDNFRKDSKSQKLNKKSYFGLSITGEIQSREKSAEDLELLVNYSKTGSEKSGETGSGTSGFQDHPHLALFCDQENVLKDLIGKEIQRANNPDVELQMKQWSASQDLAASIESQYGRLTDWHVSMAASSSFSIWQATCRAFAKQLEDNSDPVKASSYYLMVHDVDKAVQCLIEANFFQAALIIIKTRLPRDHPMISDFYKQWAVKSMQDGLYELASKCWYLAGSPIESALALAKRADGKSLSLASEILNNAGEQEQARILAFQALELFKKAKDKNGLEKSLEKSKVEEILEEIQEFIKNTTFDDKMNTNGDLEE